jgi:hypothetical protein
MSAPERKPLTRAAVTCAILCACASPDATPDAEPASADCVEAREHSDLEWIQDNVFTPSCAVAGSCHRGEASDAQGLNLEAGVAAAALIEQPAYGCFGETLVVPGRPEDSYLMAVFGVYPAGSCRIFLMPFNRAPLCKDKHDAIARWIESLPAM